MSNVNGLPATGSPQQLIAAYERLLLRCEQMLVWASTNNWEALIEEESRYVLEAEQLTIFSDAIAMEEPLNEQRMDLVERILETSLEIQRFLIARRDALGQILDGALRHRSAENGAQAMLPLEPGGGHDR